MPSRIATCTFACEHRSKERLTGKRNRKPQEKEGIPIVTQTHSPQSRSYLIIDVLGNLR